jgi:hypothetical protein
LTRWWQSDGPPERRDRDQAELPAVEAPPIAETDVRRDVIERTRRLILELPDRR